MFAWLSRPPRRTGVIGIKPTLNRHEYRNMVAVPRAIARKEGSKQASQD